MAAIRKRNDSLVIDLRGDDLLSWVSQNCFFWYRFFFNCGHSLNDIVETNCAQRHRECSQLILCLFLFKQQPSMSVMSILCVKLIESKP